TITTWLTCVTALVGALAWVALLFGVWVDWVFGMYPVLTFLALIPFALNAHRSFGWWWSLPAAGAGFLGALGYVISFVIDGPNYIAEYSYPNFVLFFPRYGTSLSASWLVPLLILGIAM